MQPRVCLATSTFYRSPDDLRYGLACKTIAAAKKEGYSIVVVDGTRAHWARNQFLKLGADDVIAARERGAGKARRQAIRFARDCDAEVIVWMEPEKHPLVSLLRPLIDCMALNRIPLIIPRRSNLDSYPPHQHYAELQGNWLIGSLTHRPDLDLWFGPRIISKAAVSFFLDYDGKYGDKWEATFIPVLRALVTGMKVGSMNVDYIHPAELANFEVGDEDFVREHDGQFDCILKALMTEWQSYRLDGERVITGREVLRKT